MLVVYAMWRPFHTYEPVYILYQIKAEIIYFVSRDYKIHVCHFTRSLRIIDFQIDAPYATVFYRCITC